MHPSRSFKIENTDRGKFHALKAPMVVRERERRVFKEGNGV